MKRYELKKEQWERVESLLPAKGQESEAVQGKSSMGCSGLPAAELSGESCRKFMAPANCVCPFCEMVGRRHTRICILRPVHRCGYGKPEFEFYLHQRARKCQWRGKSRGELNTKLHTIVDGLGNSMEFLLSEGNDHDSIHAIELLTQIEISGVAYWQTGQNIRAYILKAWGQLCDPATEQCFSAVASRLVAV